MCLEQIDARAVIIVFIVDWNDLCAPILMYHITDDFVVADAATLPLFVVFVVVVVDLILLHMRRLPSDRTTKRLLLAAVLIYERGVKKGIVERAGGARCGDREAFPFSLVAF